MKKLNSSEIARLAGVSRSTVSRVVNGYSNVPEHTRKRVMKVIDENEYYPSFSGQVLAGKKTGTLGFFWVSSGPIANDAQCSAYFVHVTESAAALGYLVLTCMVRNLTDEDNINWIKRVFMQDRVDAGVFIGVNNNEPLIEELLAKGKVIGIFDHFHPDRDEPNRISVNFENDTGEKLIDYVCARGHRKIAVIDGNMNRFSSVKRHESFIRGMQKHNVEIRREWMYYGDVSEESGYRVAGELLANCRGAYPTVICANNDATAFGVYRAAQEAGLRIPEDISVVGIDGHPRGAQTAPPLTTFAFDYNAIFFSLVSRVVDAVEQKENVPRTEFMPGKLVERGSCRCIEE